MVSISDAQRWPVADLGLRWVATIHHGLDLASAYQLGRGNGTHLVFLGRIAPEKDPVTAIRVAIRAGVPLKIAARIDPVDHKYFEDKVLPLLEHKLVEWVGEQDDVAKNELLGSARALLMPIDWDEPFGLTVIESLACGTPVISKPLGSLTELVRDGQDGFLRASEDGLAGACDEVLSLDRASCRARALKRFSMARMVADYERAYAMVLESKLAVALVG